MVCFKFISKFAIIFHGWLNLFTKFTIIFHGSFQIYLTNLKFISVTHSIFYKKIFLAIYRSVYFKIKLPKLIKKSFTDTF